MAELVADPTLDTRILAGRSGIDRPVFWAHSCEMIEPHRWLGPHELLMTIGLCIPAGSERQRDFIAQLDETGLAGIAIGDDDLAPRLTKALFAEADRRGFPVLGTGPNTPFAAIGRTVAAANAERQTIDVLRLAKLYQVAGQRTRESRRAGTDLSQLFGITLIVVDDESGCVIIGPGLLAPAGTRAYPLRTARPSHLLIPAQTTLDGFALVHLSQILTVDANLILQETLIAVSSGASRARDAFDGRTTELDQIFDVDGVEGYRVLLVNAADETDRLALTLATQGITPLLTRVAEDTLLLGREIDLPALRATLRELEITAGVSAPARQYSHLNGAAEEARSQLHEARIAGNLWSEYEGARISLLARSDREALEIVRTVLGPLERDDARFAILRETLFTLLDHDLSWKRTAAQLHVHEQTVRYRMGQAEKLTGRSVRRMSDLSELWLARTAWERRGRMGPSA